MRHGSYMLYSSKNKIKWEKYSSVIDLSKCIFQRNFGEIPVPILWHDPHVLGCPSFGEPVSTFISLWCCHARRFYSMSYMSPRRQSWELRSRQEVERNTMCSLIIKETCSEGEEGVNSGAGGECHLNTLDICMKLFKSLKKNNSGHPLWLEFCHMATHSFKVS